MYKFLWLETTNLDHKTAACYQLADAFVEAEQLG